MGVRLFSDNTRGNALFSVADDQSAAVPRMSLRQPFSKTRLTFANIQLLKLVFKLINNISRNGIGGVLLTDSGPAVGTAPGQPQSLTTEEASRRADDSQSRAALVRAAKVLLGLTRQLTSVSRGEIAGSQTKGDLYNKIMDWLSAHGKDIQAILKAGMLDPVVFAKLADPDVPVRDVVFQYGTDIAKALFKGLMERPPQIQLDRMLAEAVKAGGDRLFTSRTRELIIKLRELLLMTQRRTKSKRAVVQELEMRIASICHRGSSEWKRYERLAENILKHAEDPSALIDNIVLLLKSPHLRNNADRLVSQLAEPQRSQITRALAQFGLSVDKIKNQDIQNLENGLLKFASLSEGVISYAQYITDDLGNTVVGLLEGYNAADPSGKQGIKANILTSLTNVDKHTADVKQAIAALYDDANGPFVKQMADLFSGQVSVLEHVYTNELVPAMGQIRKALDTQEVVAPPKSASRKLAQPAAVPQSSQPPPAPDISKETQDNFANAYDKYVKTLADFTKTIHAADAKLEPLSTKGEAPAGDVDEFGIPIPRVSFKDDEKIASILKEIKSWFENNRSLIASALSSNLPGTGMFGTRTDDDMRTAVAIAQGYYKDAVALVDQLLT